MNAPTLPSPPIFTQRPRTAFEYAFANGYRSIAADSAFAAMRSGMARQFRGWRGRDLPDIASLTDVARDKGFHGPSDQLQDLCNIFQQWAQNNSLRLRLGIYFHGIEVAGLYVTPNPSRAPDENRGDISFVWILQRQDETRVEGPFNYHYHGMQACNFEFCSGCASFL